MTDPNETANLVAGITAAWREHVAEEAAQSLAAAVPGRVLGSDIEGQADALAEGTARLAARSPRSRRNPAGHWTPSRCSGA